MLNGGPKVIWFHWMQGQAAMPAVVAGCLNSWRRNNPDWEVVFVDAQSLWRHVDRSSLPVDALLGSSPQVYANAVRLRLLEAHGGVWADATTWCARPLSDWLPAVPGEFFAFASPNKDRILSNWFLAAEKGCYLVETMARTYVDVFGRLGPLTVQGVTPDLEDGPDTDRLVEPLLQGHGRQYPYFLFHYLFAHLCRRDPRFHGTWSGSERIQADAGHLAQRLGLKAPASETTRAQLRAAQPHVIKLNWRIPVEPGTVMHDILSGNVWGPSADATRQDGSPSGIVPGGTSMATAGGVNPPRLRRFSDGSGGGR